MRALEEVLLEASRKNALREAEVCLQEGADANCKGVFETPLINAVRNGNYDMAKCLIENGADVNLETFGTTPLIETILFGHKRVVDNKMWTNSFGDKYYKVLTLLVENDADFKIEDGDGKDAYYHIVERGLLERFDSLLKSHDLFDEGYLQEIYQKIQDDKIIEKGFADAFSPVER